MTPAEHYAAAEKILAEVGEEAEGLGEDPVALAESGAWEVAASMVQLGLAEAQVHATLATASRDVSQQAYAKSQQQVVTDQVAPEGCTCPRLASQPLARTGLDPACPAHGINP